MSIAPSALMRKKATCRQLQKCKIEDGRICAALPVGECTLSDPSGGLDGIRIVVVEDDDDTRELIALILETHGGIVFPTSNVKDGLDAVRKYRPDAVVSDIGMPEHNGYALIAAVRKEPEHGIRSMKVIALTAFATPADRDSVLISGFDDYLTKPVDPVQLVTAVRRLGEQQRNTAA